jgi:malonyl-CoA/methylmalonyl-CoA synthetase
MIELVKRASDFSKRIAVISNQKEYSYDQLLCISNSIANSLLDRQKDLSEERVVFLTPPSFEYVAVQWAIWRAGGIAVPLCNLQPPPIS